VVFIGDDQIEALDRDRRVVADDALRLARTGLETRLLLFLLGQLAARQQRIDALDRGDDDRGVLVETGRPEPLDIVELGKGTAGAGRAKILELVPRLAHQIGAVR
jgi:hypothetical protein